MTSFFKRLVVSGLVVSAFSVLAVAPAAAAAADTVTFTKPIRIIVPYSAGGSADLTARLLAEHLTPRLGQSVTVENQPGANGAIGTGNLAKAPADGHTLGFVVSSHVFAKVLAPNLPFDPIKDFSPVTLATRNAVMLVATPSLPVQNVPELIAYAKAHPNQLAFASAGNGSNLHIFGQWFVDRAGLQMVHVPYKGSTPAHVDLMAGRTHIMFDTLGALQPHIKAGKLKLLAAGAERLPQYPNLPTVAESGFPGFRAESWGAVLAPAQTPAPVVAVLQQNIAAILNMPAVRKRLEEAGAQVVASTPAELGAILVEDEIRYGKLMRSMGIKPD